MPSVAELVVRIVTDTAGATKDLSATSSKVSKFQSGVQKAAVPAAAALLGLGAAAISAGNAAADDAQQQAILANTMQKTTGANSKAVAAMEDWISSTSRATGVADDELRPAMGNLLRATGDAAESQKAMNTALDISAATGADLQSVTKALGKAYGGNTSSLKRLVPSISDAALESGNMDRIMGELAKTTGGAAAKAADTTAGKMKIMQNSMGEAQEEIGTALLPAMSGLADILTKVAGFAQKHPKLFVAIAVAVGVLAASVIALNVAMKLVTIATQLFGKTAVRAWLSALGPIALVIVAVGLVIAIVVVLWKKSETFRKVVLAVWGAIKAGALLAWRAIRSAWNAVVNAMSSGARSFKNLVVNVWNGLRATVSVVIGAIRNAWNSLTQHLKEAWSNAVSRLREVFANFREWVVGAWQAIREKVGTVTGAIREAWSNMVGALRSAASNLGSLLSAPFNTAKEAVDRLIGLVQSLVSWLGRIKVPDLGGIGKLVGKAVPGSAAAPSVAGFAVPRGAVGGRAATGGGGLTIVVNGAVDPEATARQIDRILRGHNRRMGLRA